MSLFEGKIFQEGLEFVNQRTQELSVAAADALSIPTIEPEQLPAQPLAYAQPEREPVFQAPATPIYQPSAELVNDAKLAEAQPITRVSTRPAPAFETPLATGEVPEINIEQKLAEIDQIRAMYGHKIPDFSNPNLFEDMTS